MAEQGPYEAGHAPAAPWYVYDKRTGEQVSGPHDKPSAAASIAANMNRKWRKLQSEAT